MSLKVNIIQDDNMKLEEIRKDFREEIEKEKKELEESYKESVRQTKERKHLTQKRKYDIENNNEKI